MCRKGLQLSSCIGTLLRIPEGSSTPGDHHRILVILLVPHDSSDSGDVVEKLCGVEEQIRSLGTPMQGCRWVATKAPGYGGGGLLRISSLDWGNWWRGNGHL